MGRLFRLSALTGLVLLLLLAGGIGFTETASFRSMMNDYLTALADSSLNARLTIDDIDGSLFSGWKLSGVHLTDEHGSIIEIESVVLRYSLLRLPWKTARIHELTLNAPRITVTRANGRDWNINTMLKPSDEEADTTATTFDWDIRVEHLRILDGQLLVYDSTAPGPASRNRLDATHMKLTDLNVAMSAHITEKRKALSINRFTFHNAFGSVSFKNLSGDIALTSDGADVKDLSIQTARSGMILSARLRNADILQGFDAEVLPDLPMRVQLDAPKVAVTDLQYFLPSLDILGDEARLSLDAEGSLRQLDINALELEAGRSSISFVGRLKDILDGTGMHIDVVSDDTRVHGDDIPLLLPGIPILDLHDVGTAHFSHLLFRGYPLNFHAEMDMESDAGSASGQIALDLTGEELVYDGLLRTRKLDLSKVLRAPRLRSSLNVQAAIRGTGTRIGGMVAQLNVQADSSMYQKAAADKLRMTVDVETDSLTLHLQSRLGAGNVLCDGGMSFQPDSITGFRLEGNAGKLDLARLLNDQEMSSDLSFTFKSAGDGVDIASSSGNVEIAFEQSRFRDITIEPDTFRVVLQQSRHDTEYLLLQSQYADARIEGRFDFTHFASYLSRQADSLTAAVNRFAFAPDSAAAEEAEAAQQTGDGGGKRFRKVATKTSDAALPVDTTAFMDVFYSISLKHPERIARYFNANTFILRGTYRGNIRGGEAGFAVDGQLQLSDFYLVDSTRSWLAAGVRCDYTLNDLTLTDPLRNLNADLRFAVADLNLNGLRMSRTSVQLGYKNMRPELRIRSMVDTLLQLDVQAFAEYNDYGFDVQIPLLKLNYLHEQLLNDRTAKLRVDSTGIGIEHFALRKEAMRFSVTGKRSFEGDNNFTIYGDSLSLGMVEYLATGAADAREGQSFSGMASLEANVSGDDAAPLMAAAVYIDSLGYRGMHFGEMMVEARYNTGKLELYSEFDYDKSDGTQDKVFFASGTVPVQISFANEEEEAPPADTEARLRVQVKDFPLGLVEDFLGFFSPLEGSAFGDITVTGTAAKPSFNGYVTISNAKGRFVINNMEYLVNLRIEAADQSIRIVKANLANVAQDWKQGKMEASGSITTDAFSIAEFDLAVEGQLKVLNPATRATLRALYGDLYIGTGGEPLTYSGRLDRSRLLGNIVIKRGNLTFPLENTQGGVNEYADIKYVVVDDTTTRVVSSLSAGRFGRSSRLGGSENDSPQMRERSVLEGLSYDLRLSTEGSLIVEIPLSVLQEELNAELEFDDLRVSSFGSSGMTFVGEVKLGEASSFLFFGKRLSADGSLYFTRDPFNPDLDLRAVYSDYYINPRTDQRRKVFVSFKIRGTKNKPRLEGWDMRWDEANGEPVAAAGDVQSDAFSFILFGVFAKDISSNEGEGSSLVAKSQDMFNQMGSSIASSAANQFLNKAGLNDVIKRVDFSNLGTENSRVKLTSEIGQSVITYDGKISDLGSSNITVEFPVSRITGVPWLDQIIQISRITTNQNLESTSQSQEYSVWELKILQRFSF